VRGRKSADFRVDTSHELLDFVFSLSFYKSQIKRFGDECKDTQALVLNTKNRIIYRCCCTRFYSQATIRV